LSNDINNLTIVGRLTRDPEARIAGSTSLASFSIACGRTFTTNGEKREETVFLDCTAWGRLGEIVIQYAGKGKQVAITGRLKQDNWTTQEGQKRSKIGLVVETLQLLGGRADSAGQAPPGGEIGLGSAGQTGPDDHFFEDDIPF